MLINMYRRLIKIQHIKLPKVLYVRYNIYFIVTPRFGTPMNQTRRNVKVYNTIKH